MGLNTREVLTLLTYYTLSCNSNISELTQQPYASTLLKWKRLCCRPHLLWMKKTNCLGIYMYTTGTQPLWAVNKSKSGRDRDGMSSPGHKNQYAVYERVWEWYSGQVLPTREYLVNASWVPLASTLGTRDQPRICFGTGSMTLRFFLRVFIFGKQLRVA